MNNEVKKLRFIILEEKRYKWNINVKAEKGLKCQKLKEL